MNTPNPFLLSLYFLLLFQISGYQRVEGHSVFKAKTLFVFGDSFVDAGNNPIETTYTWKQPYGITYPGKPTGRYSDGRVSSDFFARFLGIKSPVPYKLMNNSSPRKLRHGMNFAHGGAGLFDTIFGAPNTTKQVGFFEEVIRQKVYSAADFECSVALINVASNDYITYGYKASNHIPHPDLKTYTSQLVNQLVVVMKRIHGLGVRKVVVAALPPMGCFPGFAAASGYQRCNKEKNSEINFHNILLREALAKLNQETNNNRGPTFVILDLYNAFLTVLENKGGGKKFGNPLLRQCCLRKCGFVDKDGSKMYDLCKNPKRTFFWDDSHPTQKAWRVIYPVLLSNFTLS